MADDKRPYHERYRPAPPPDYMRYLTAPFTGYWNRQGNLAREGLAMADQGAQQVRGGDLSGYLGMFLGPLGYVSSPINALFPTDQEVYASDLPDWFKPAAAGAVGTAAVMAPGPKTRGLGRGMSALVDDATAAERAALAARLETEAAQTGGQASGVARDQALRNLTEAPPEGITAYHGSPHTFDKFDMSKIGTGEGAQAYGHGLYFAENEKVAKGYRDTLAVPSGDFSDDARLLTQAHLADVGGDVARLRENLKIDLGLPEGEIHPAARKRAATVLDYLNAHGAPELPGSMYQVRLNVRPYELLDWDRPLSEQPQSIRDALKSAGAVGPKQADWSMSGGKVLENMKTDPAFAADMRKAGVKGIRYKDAGSRGAEGGTYNYVIFDDKLVDILKRYAIPFTLGAGGAAIVSGQDMPPEIAAQMGPQG